MRLHGRFGNAFFDKFRIGSLNAQGQDIGIENAKIVWSEELAGTSPERIKAALEASYEYAPSCDDFKSNCFIRKQIEDFKQLPHKFDAETQKKNLEKVNEAIAAMSKPKTDYHAWAKRIMQAPNKYPEISVNAAKEVIGEAVA